MRKIEFWGLTALLAGGIALTVSSDSEAAGTTKHAGIAGTYGIQLGGQTVGFASSVAGGGQNGTVAFDRAGSPGSYPKKRHVPAAPDEIVLSVGTADKTLTEWVRGTVNTGSPQKRDGAVVVFSPDFREISRTSWQRGAIVGVDFPELDASAKKPWQIELTIAPEVSTFSTAGGGKPDPGMGLQKSKAGLTTTSNFRMSMPGLDLKRVLLIEEIEARYQPAVATKGADTLKTGSVDVSNLAFVLPEADAAQLYTWHQATRASTGDKEKKTAVIELLTPTLQPSTTKITLNGVGILRVGPLPSAAGGDTTRKVRAECFVESIQLEM